MSALIDAIRAYRAKHPGTTLGEAAKACGYRPTPMATERPGGCPAVALLGSRRHRCERRPGHDGDHSASGGTLTWRQ